MKTDTLRMAEHNGGYSHETQCWYLDENRAIIPNRPPIRENWRGEEMAMQAASARVRQGYRVDVYLIVAESFNSQ